MSLSPTPSKLRGKNYVRRSLRAIIDSKKSTDADKLRALELLSEIQRYSRKDPTPKSRKPALVVSAPVVSEPTSSEQVSRLLANLPKD